jgi:hypothetical protein
MEVRRRGLIAVAAAALATLALAPAAQADFGFQGLSSAPTNTKAGAHSDVDIHIGFTSAGDNVKDLTVGLPPGLVGDPTATPLCTPDELNSDSCPDASQVGTVTTKVHAHVTLLSLPLTVNGSLYNVEPAAGEPARFGIVLRPLGSDPIPLLEKIKQFSDVSLRPHDFGLNTSLTDIPNVAHAVEGAVSVPIDINSIDIQLDGTVGGHGFMRNPTSCGNQRTTFTADSYANPGQEVTGQASYRATHCKALPFSPSVTADVGSPGHTAAGSNPPLRTVISQGDGESGLKAAQLLLPSGILVPNTGPLSNPCPIRQFRTDATACPASSQVGTATATSPLLPSAETGGVVVVSKAKGAFLPRLGVDLHGPLTLQLLGSFVATGQGIGNAFMRLPDIPISTFELDFSEDGLLSTTLNLCSKPPPTLNFPTTLTSFNGTTVTPTVQGTIEGC